MKRFLLVWVPCIECGGEGGTVSELLDTPPPDLPIIRPGDDMPVLYYNQSEFVIEVEL